LRSVGRMSAVRQGRTAMHQPPARTKARLKTTLTKLLAERDDILLQGHLYESLASYEGY
jgi:hypothetical protein